MDMVTWLLAFSAKQKFINELEKNISKKRDFKTIKCRAVVPAKYEVCLMLSSVCSEERKTISVTAEKNECIHTENLFTGTNSEILEWLCKISIKELSQKADKALYNCSHFYYP